MKPPVLITSVSPRLLSVRNCPLGFRAPSPGWSSLTLWHLFKGSVLSGGYYSFSKPLMLDIGIPTSNLSQESPPSETLPGQCYVLKFENLNKGNLTGMVLGGQQGELSCPPLLINCRSNWKRWKLQGYPTLAIAFLPSRRKVHSHPQQQPSQ